jgi:hypothetical protein
MCSRCYYFEEDNRSILGWCTQNLYYILDRETHKCPDFLNIFEGEWRAIIDQSKNNRNIRNK